MKDKIIVWLDTETTGLDTVRCSPIQIGIIVEKNGEIIDSSNITLQPFKGASITNEALSTHNIDINTINTYQSNNKGFLELLNILNKHVNVYSKDKAYFGGYNTKFDFDMLDNLFKVNGATHFSKYFEWRHLDIMQIITPLQFMEKLPVLKNNKLQTWCEYFSIEIKAHDALSDIEATRNLFYKIKQKLGGNSNV